MVKASWSEFHMEDRGHSFRAMQDVDFRFLRKLRAICNEVLPTACHKLAGGITGRHVAYPVSRFANVVVTEGVDCRKAQQGHFASSPGRNLSLKISPLPSQDATGAKVLVLADRQGIEVYIRHWPAAASDTKGCLLMVHGYTWHSAYFAETAQLFAKRGFGVVAFDLAAHGLSGSVTGVPGYHPSFTDLVDQAELVLEHSQQQLYPGLPSFVYGESLGAAIVLTLVQRPAVAAATSGVITAGAVTELPPVLPPKPVMALLKAVAKVLPLAKVPGDKATEEEGWIGAFGDKDLARKAFKEDPLVVKSTRLGTMAAIVPAVESLHGNLEKITLPLLVLHGLEDTRTRPLSSQLLHDRAVSSDKELHLYEGMHHQLLQETPAHKQRVWEDITTWLTKHL